MGEKKPVSKLGIYVPDNRLKDVEKWREKVNFSELFWKAFDNEIALRATSQVKGSDMEKLIERLKVEAGRDMEEGKLKGAECGREWALEHATRRDFQIVDEGVPAHYGDLLGFLLAECDALYPAEWWDDLVTGVSDEAAFRLGFCRGFDAAVHEIWSKVKKSL